jgi:FkbM family methyltransferase
MAAIAKIERIAADDDSKQRLVEIVGKLVMKDFTNSDDVANVRLRIRDKVLDLVFPAVEFSYALLYEIFIRDEYAIDAAPVELIYDLGANIGFAALYLHALNPAARIVCVEPMAQNCRFLADNLKRNGVDHEVHELAVGDRRGEIDIHTAAELGSQSTITSPEAVGPGGHTVKIRSVPYDELVRGEGYGMKIDVEGAEHLASKYPGVVGGARWMQGELHYTTSIRHDEARAFEAQLREKMDVRMTPARLTRRPFAVSRMFQATR